MIKCPKWLYQLAAVVRMDSLFHVPSHFQCSRIGRNRSSPPQYLKAQTRAKETAVQNSSLAPGTEELTTSPSKSLPGLPKNPKYVLKCLDSQNK